MAGRDDRSQRSTSPYHALSRPDAWSSSNGTSRRQRAPSLPYPNGLRSSSRSKARSWLPCLPRQYVRVRTAVWFAFGAAVLVLLVTLRDIHPDLDPPMPAPAPLSPAALAANSLSKPKAGAEGEEVVEEEEQEISRSFEEPDFALLSGRQPHEIGCDVPVDWRGRAGMGPEAGPNEDENGVLVFLGVFSSADKKGRRMLYRELYWSDFPDHLVTKRFILGKPPTPPHPQHPSAIEWARTLREMEEEAKEYGDMVILDMEDNIDFGKTHKYYQWVANEYGGPGRVKGRPRFVMKSDDDTLLVMPNMIRAFQELDCSKAVYWGTSSGRSPHFQPYFRGLAYAMSWPLVSWIGSANMPKAHIVKIEDARTGQWLRSLDPVTDPIQRIDMGWTMGDWNQLDVGVETTALHWLKLDEWVREQHERILDVWSNASIPYEWDKGIDPARSIAKGKLTPEEADKENRRQKELGWDVGNIREHSSED